MVIGSSLVSRYFIAIAAVAAGVFLRLLITDQFGPGLPTYVTFYPAIIFTALLAGYGPGFIATIAFALIADLWLLAPIGRLSPGNIIEAIGLGFFILMGVLITLFMGRYRGIRGKLEILVKERTREFNAANEQLRAEIRERILAEDALRGSKDFARRRLDEIEQLYRTTPVGLCVLDVDLRYVKINERLAQMNGHTVEEHLGVRMRDLIPEIADLVEPMLLNVLKTGQGILDQELTAESAPGMRGYFTVSYLPLFDNAGRVTGINAVIEDITDRKRAENAVRESEERLRFHTENSPMAVVEWNTEFVVTRWAGEAERMFGWSAAETVGKPLAGLNMVYEEDIPIVENVMARLAGGGMPHVVSTNRNYTKSGNIIHCTWYNSILKDTQGRMKSVLSQVLDITGSVAAEQLIKQNARELQLILDSVPAIVYYKDLNNRFIRINKEFEKIMGREKSELEGRSLSELYPAEQAEAFRRDDLEVAESKRPKTGILEPMETIQGTRWVQTHKVPFFDEKGEVAGIIGFAVDISERLRIEGEIRRKEADLMEAQRIAHLGSWYWDAATDVTVGSDELLRIYGFDPATQKMPDFKDQKGLCYPEEEWEKVNSAVEQTVQTGIGYELDVQAFRNGAPIWVTTRSERICDAAGAVIGLRGTVQDITERKKAEQALRDSEYFYHETLESIPGMVFTTRPDGYCDFQSQQWVDFTGVPMIEHLGNGWNKLLHPGDRPRAFAAWRAAVEEKAPYDLEYRVRHFDGTYEWFKVRGNPIRDASGKIMRWFGVAVSIEGIKKAQDALSASRVEALREKNRLEAVMEALSVGVAILDEKGENIQSNLEFEKIWGSTIPRTTGINDYDFHKAWWLDSGEKVLADEWASARAVKNGETVIGQAMRIERFDGSKAYIQNSAAPILDSQLRIDGCAVSLMDITAYIEAQERLRQSTARFETLAMTAAELLRNPEPQKLVERLCTRIMRMLDCQVFFNFLSVFETGKLYLNACAGIPEEEVRRIRWLDYGVAVCGCVARDGSRIVAEQIQCTTDPRTELVKSYGVRAYACHPLMGEEGKVIGTLSFGSRTRDTFSDDDLSLMKAVTDQVATAMVRLNNEEELRARELQARKQSAELETVFSAQTDAILVYGPDATVIRSNAAARAMLGFDPLGKKLEHTPDAAGTGAGAELGATFRALKGETVTNGISEFIDPAGLPRTLLSSSSPMRDSEGTILGAVTVSRDITERRRAEQALRESESRLRHAESIAHLGHWSLDLETNEYSWSDEMYRIFGVNRADFIPRRESLGVLIHPDDIALFEGAIGGACMEGTCEFELRGLRSDGSVRYLSGGGEALRSEQGRPVNVFGTILDVTDLRRTERDLYEKNAELERFTYSISHDLKSPLVTIKTFLEYLKKDLYRSDSEKIEKDILYMNNAAERMGRLLGEILEMSRVGRVGNPPVRVSFRETVSEALGLVAGQVTKRGVEIQVEDSPAVFFGDRARLVEIWQNLVENAVKFLGDREDPRIEIGVEGDGRDAVFFVRDNGTGIDPRFHEKIFGLFEKLDPKTEGTGLGLALVKKIVETLDGRIVVESAGPGEGACFRFTLPEAMAGIEIGERS
ncbi:MAG: PAS domain S-box protein [Spirochaetes bacterium]|nr:MAG: PAS domain S-box protein [Spirochaetota bacterium]